jgi:hypothetical protein
VASSVLAKMAVEISANSAEFTKSLKSAEGSLKGFVGGVQKVAGVAALALSAFSFASIGQDIVQITSKFQKFQAVLTNTLGSRSAALSAMDDISEFASKTPFSVDELTASFVKLANQGFKPTTDEIRKLGDLAASTGKGFDQLTEAIIDAQTGEFERLKEFGIRAKKEGDKVTFTFKDVQKQVDFTGESIREYVLGLGDAVGVSGAMASISGTLGGKMSNLGDNLDQIGVALGNQASGLIGGFLDFANTALGAVNKALNDHVGKLQVEQAELNVLVDSITDVNTTEEARKVLLTELNQKYPDFLKNLNAETVTNEQLRGRMEEVNAQFERKILLVAAEKQLGEVSEKIIDTVNREAKARKDLAEAQRDYAKEKEAQDRQAGTGLALTNKSALEIANAENDISRALEERKTLQSELRESTKAYGDALGLFNKTNNDYFAGQEKAVKSDEEANKVRLGLIAQIQKQIKDFEDSKTKAFDTKVIADFNVKIQELKDQLDVLNSIGSESGFLKNLEKNLTLGIKTEIEDPKTEVESPFPTTLDIDIQPYKDKLLEAAQAQDAFGKMSAESDEQRRARQDALIAQQEKQNQTALQFGEVVGDAFGRAAAGQITFKQALKATTQEILKMFLQRALAGVVAGAAGTTAPPPVILALAAAGMAGVLALFSSFGGPSSGGGGAGSTLPRTNVSKVTPEPLGNTGPERLEFVIHGEDLVTLASSQNKRNERLKG